jgi:hypothetical protein
MSNTFLSWEDSAPPAPLPPPLAIGGDYDDVIFSFDGSVINQQVLRFVCMYLGLPVF